MRRKNAKIKISESRSSEGEFVRRNGLAETKLVRTLHGFESWSSESEGATSVLSSVDSGVLSSVDSGGAYLTLGCPKPSDFGIVVDSDGTLGIDRTLVKKGIAEIRDDFERNGFFFDQRLQPSKLPMQLSVPKKRQMKGCRFVTKGFK